jgi:hypothetical protein
VLTNTAGHEKRVHQPSLRPLGSICNVSYNVTYRADVVDCSAGDGGR